MSSASGDDIVSGVRAAGESKQGHLDQGITSHHI